MKASTKRVLAFAGGGGVLGALTVVGAPVGVLGGLLLGAAVEVFGRSRGADSMGAEGVATIEEARFAKNELARKLFAANADVPWWLVGVGIGGSEGNWFVLVSVTSDAPPNEARRLATSIQGVPVTVDASGTQSLEMRTGL